MRIEAVELIQIGLRLKEPFQASIGVKHDRPLILAKVMAEGVTGWGEVSCFDTPTYNYETLETAWHVLKDFCVPELLGKSIDDPTQVPSMYGWVRGHNFAKAAVENAVWDAYARTKGVPLSQLLGGVKDRIDVGVSIGIQKSPADLVKVVERFAQQGYKRMKIKIGPGHDVEEMQTVRRALPHVPVMADANSAYTLNDVDIFKAMDELGLMMFEQPLEHDDIIDHAQLQRVLKTSVCLDESIHTAEDARKALELGSCRIINIKVGRVGGLTASKAIHDLMHSKGLPVWCGGMFESGVGRAINIHMTAMPGFTLPGDTSASDRYYHEDIVDEPAVLNSDGTLTVPTRPGIGVEVLPDRLKKYTERSLLIK